jgi:hypothetical protein
VYASLRRQYGVRVPAEELADLTCEMFHDVYLRKIDRFQPAKPGLSATAKSRRVSRWFCTIARNKLIDTGPRDARLDDNGWEAQEAPIPLDCPDPKVPERVLALMQRELTPIQFEVLQWSLTHWYVSKDRKLVVPPAGARELAKRLGKTVDYIRQIRHRAYDKMTKALRAEFPELEAGSAR